MDDKQNPTSSSASKATHETADHIDTTSIPTRERTTPNTPRPVRDSSSTNAASTKRFQPKRAASATNSPIPSRESSPNRPTLRGNPSIHSAQGAGRSRKNSVQDVSPSRLASASTNPPSAAATPRALSAAPIPTLHPSISEPPIRAPVPQKPSNTSEVREVPHWPISPRLRSPPPIQRPSILSPRRSDQQVPLINVQRSSYPVESQEGKQSTSNSEAEDTSPVTGMRTPARGVSGASSTLETVQEISNPNTPSASIGIDGALEMAENGPSKAMSEKDASDTASVKTLKAKPSLPSNESGSDSGGKGEVKLRSTSTAPTPPVRQAPSASKSFSTGTGRGKPPGEGSTKSMTVETETVSSIPQVAVGTAGGGNNGSIRTKPSSETIRPKKEKKKARKAPSVTSGTGEQANSSKRRHHHHHHHFTREAPEDGNVFPSLEEAYGQGPYSTSMSSGATSPERSVFTPMGYRRPSLNRQAVSTMLTKLRPASSKADIFEAKVASAVDEADSSDSEETFVYESNPPDTSDRPRRFHSRTPSATSMASQIDQRNGVRSMMEANKSVAMKKSMKFANSYNNSGQESTNPEDDGKGTIRSSMGTNRGTTHHHHIGGRWGRNGGNGHPSLFDNESPFPNASKSKLQPNNSPGQSPQFDGGRISNMRMAGKKSPISAAYDFDDTADDERTPLMNTVRSSRSGRGRRPAASLRQLEHQAYREDKSCFSRNAGCLVLFLMFILVAAGGIGFYFATTVALTEVKILALKNVLASEQEVMLDMKVQARNANLVAVTIDTSDLVVFAKSKYAGTDSEWWANPGLIESTQRRRRRWGTRDDDPLDPPLGDDPNTNPNLEIGRVFEFYSPLVFDASPFHHVHETSLGQIRVNHPGNRTVPAGSERWGRVLQHEFDLIVRGTLKYTLPLSQRIRSVSVEGRVTVKPNAADQDPDTVHIIEGTSVTNMI